MPAILIVSAATDVATTLREPLREAGHRILTAGSPGEALSALRELHPELLLVDLELLADAGLTLCRDVRANPETMGVPLLAITANATETDRLAVLELGADDLVTKPFSVRELVLRVRAVLRRSQARGHDPHRSPRRVGPIEVDFSTHQAFVDGVAIRLTPLELRFLAHLMASVGRVQTRDELLARVWNATPALKTRTVDSHAKRLRAKLGAAGSLLQTVRGVGYRLVAPAEPEPRAPQARSG
jgi:two-component system phosphate regulon response regulator PhoB